MTAKPETDAAEPKDEHQRVAKVIARAGLCSRRDAESWILDGRVSVNDTVLTSPAMDVGATDRVLVDGVPLPAADKTRLFLFHKPRGFITSDHDPEGRETIFDYLREHWPDGPRVVTIGRLDINTEGLLLLTNDGGLARILELPKTGWIRRYRVRAKGATDQGVLDRLADGITIEGVDYAGIEAKLDRIQGANCWLTMGLREGKNREVKRVLEHIGLDVNRLIRLSFGPFQLLDLPEGHVEEVKTRILRDQLGPSLAAEAGVDFTEAEPIAPIVAPPKLGERKAGGRMLGRPDRAGQPVRALRGDARIARDDRGAKDEKGRKSAPRGVFRDRDRTDDRAVPAAAPEKRERPAAGPRKHVSTLRAQTGTALRAGPRTRVERSDTVDRKHRTVTVERRVASAPTVEARHDREPPRRERDARSRSERVPREREATLRREPESTPRRERETTALDTPRRVAKDSRPSLSALGKRERIARSGGAARPERSRAEARPERSRADARPERSRADARPERSRADARPERSRADARPERSRADARPERSRADARPTRPGSRIGQRGDQQTERASGRPARRDQADAPAKPRTASRFGDKARGSFTAKARNERGSDEPRTAGPPRPDRAVREGSPAERRIRGKDRPAEKPNRSRPASKDRPAARTGPVSRKPRGASPGDRPKPPRRPRA